MTKASQPYNTVYMPTTAVTSKELEAIRAIRNSLMHVGRIPSMRQLMTSLGYQSPRSASLIVEKLIKKGVLRRKKDGGLQFIKNLVILLKQIREVTSIELSLVGENFKVNNFLTF